MATTEEQPGLRSLSFSCMTLTQFLGAFNDNAFKQLILLLAVDATRPDSAGGTGGNQALATALFSLPFILFSGFAGNLSDRFSKTRIVVLAKVAEIIIMGLGAVGFWMVAQNWSGGTAFLLATLFLMGSQSAFFGPAKYGILPQMLPDRSLSRANGIILMTTFLAIIMGTAVAGWLRDASGDQLHKPALLYILIAVVGTGSALLIRRFPAAQPGLRIRGKPLGDLWPTLKSIASDRAFLLVICGQSFFWFLGGVMLTTVNVYGRVLMKLDNKATSFLLVSLQAGMAVGGILGGVLSRRSVDFRMATWGAGGMAVALTALTVAHHSLIAMHASLFILGASGTLFSLPLQTYVQLRPSADEKGRVVAAANFANWVFIFLSALYFGIFEGIGWERLSPTWIPGSLAVLTLLVTIYLRPRLREIARQLGE